MACDRSNTHLIVFVHVYLRTATNRGAASIRINIVITRTMYLYASYTYYYVCTLYTRTQVQRYIRELLGFTPMTDRAPVPMMLWATTIKKTTPCNEICGTNNCTKRSFLKKIIFHNKQVSVAPTKDLARISKRERRKNLGENWKFWNKQFFYR